jgi:hypothetical protein
MIRNIAFALALTFAASIFAQVIAISQRSPEILVRSHRGAI